MDESDLQKTARRRVEMKRGFIVHLLLYITVNAMLFAIWFGTGRGYPWFLWPLAGWGIGIVANAITVAMELWSPQQRAIEREVQRLQHSR